MLGVTRNAILCACQFPQIIPIMFSSSVSCATIWATEDNSSHHLAKASALSTTQNPLTSVSRYVLRIANIQQVFLYKFFPTGVTRNNIKKEILYCFFTRINRHIFFLCTTHMWRRRYLSQWKEIAKMSTTPVVYVRCIKKCWNSCKEKFFRDAKWSDFVFEKALTWKTEKANFHGNEREKGK